MTPASLAQLLRVIAASPPDDPVMAAGIDASVRTLTAGITRDTARCEEERTRRKHEARLSAALTAMAEVVEQMPPAEEDDRPVCRTCQQPHEWEEIVSAGDEWECQGCWKEWLAEVFQACQHAWEPVTNQHGEPARYCASCGACIEDDAFPQMFPGVPLPERPAAEAQP